MLRTVLQSRFTGLRDRADLLVGGDDAYERLITGGFNFTIVDIGRVELLSRGINCHRINRRQLYGVSRHPDRSMLGRTPSPALRHEAHAWLGWHQSSDGADFTDPGAASLHSERNWRGSRRGKMLNTHRLTATSAADRLASKPPSVAEQAVTCLRRTGRVRLTYRFRAELLRCAHCSPVHYRIAAGLARRRVTVGRALRR